MERLTTNKLVSEMGIVDLAYNCCFAKDGEAWYRDFEKELSLRDYIRWLYKTHLEIELPEDFEVFDNYILTDLECGEEYGMGFVIAFLYHMMWSKADLYERLKRYEDLEEQGLLLILKKTLKEILMDYFDIENDTYAYNLTRVKSAFAVGTMSFDDFEEFNEATIDDIVGYIKAEAEKALAEMEKGND